MIENARASPGASESGATHENGIATGAGAQASGGTIDVTGAAAGRRDEEHLVGEQHVAAERRGPTIGDRDAERAGGTRQARGRRRLGHGELGRALVAGDAGVGGAKLAQLRKP